MEFAENAQFWIGVASRDHVKVGERGGFCQLCHGKMAAVKRMKKGDGIIYYSPRKQMRAGAIVQAFTAVGQVIDDEPYEFEQKPGFRPMRRDVTYLPSREVPIRPMLQDLSFLSDNQSWGLVFRQGSFRIPREDFRKIVEVMAKEHIGW